MGEMVFWESLPFGLVDGETAISADGVTEVVAEGLAPAGVIGRLGMSTGCLRG